MKKNKLILLLLCLSTSYVFAQTDIVVAYNSNHSGRNASLTASKFLSGRHELGFGLRFNFNKFAHPDDQNNTFKKRLYATKPLHHLGLEGFYHLYLFSKLKNIKPFIFYDMQITHSPTRNRSLLPYSSLSDGTVLYKEHINNFGPFTWLEQNIGIGFRANITSNCFIQQKIGYGTSFIMGYDDMLLGKIFNWFDWEFGYLINVGIGYRLGESKRKSS